LLVAYKASRHDPRDVSYAAVLKRRGNPLLGDRIQMMDRINFSLGIASASITTVAARRKSKHVCMLSKAQNTSKKRLAQDHVFFLT
jgi:hypothetical protein